MLIHDGRKAIEGDVAERASVSQADAERAARTRTDGTVDRAFKGLANEPTLIFDANRTSDKFEQVQAYHAVTEAQLYTQSLGFTNVNNESQDLLINTIAVDNSFYDSAADTIRLGRGGVDDAEDEDIVWHEVGHTIHDDQVPGYGIGHDAGSIGEAWGDYWGVTMSQPINEGYEVPCVGDRDSVSYARGPIHCLRRTDTNKTLAHQTGEVHADGEIWSRALWDINRLLGRDRANTVILEAQFSYSPATSFQAAAQTTVATARALYGRRVAVAAFAAFRARGIL